VLDYLGTKVPKYRTYSISQLKKDDFNFPYESFSQDRKYDLIKAKALFDVRKYVPQIIDGKRVVGSVIRICKDMNQQSFADELLKIVEKFFLPYDRLDHRYQDILWIPKK
jgi:hypothetical protein